MDIIVHLASSDSCHHGCGNAWLPTTHWLASVALIAFGADSGRTMFEERKESVKRVLKAYFMSLILVVKDAHLHSGSDNADNARQAERLYPVKIFEGLTLPITKMTRL